MAWPVGRGLRGLRHVMVTFLVSIVAACALMLVLVRLMEPKLAFFPTRGECETPRQFGLSFESLTIDTADGEHLRAWLMRAPSPRANVVYFHGNGGNLSNWTPILAGIVRHGYSLFAFDYRGYGLSTGQPSERGLYRDVEAVVKQAWTAGESRVPTIYWGRSLGASMASYAATVRAPDGVILESGFTSGRAVVRTSIVLWALSVFASYRFPTADFANRAGRAVLVMHGNRDSVIPFALGRELFDRLTVEKHFFVIEGGDHNDEIPQDAGAYWSAVDRFMSDLRRP